MPGFHLRILSFYQLAAVILLHFVGCGRHETPRSVSPATEVNASAEEKSAGVGLALRIDGDRVFVGQVLPDSPAARSRVISENDEIMAIAQGDGEPVPIAGMEMSKIVPMIRGPNGSVVRLTLIPAGKTGRNARVVNIVRGEVAELDLFGDGSLIAVGSQAPNFKFTRLSDGSAGELAQFAGKVVVLNFWTTGCGPCIKHMPEFENLLRQNPAWENKVELLAVSVDDSQETAARLSQEKQWETAVWGGQKLFKTYNFAALPTVYIIDQQGNVAAADAPADFAEIVSGLLQEADGG